jgi:hypothetical protein
MSSHVLSAFALTVAVGFGLFDRGIAAQNRPVQPAVTASGQSPAMQGMAKMHEQMMAEMQAGVARLDPLLKQMNAANGDAKVAAIAAVVNELAAQHTSMHQRMGQMHREMMNGRGMMMNR